MSKKVLTSAKAPAALGPYCQAYQCGDLVITSGQLGMIPSEGKLADGVEAQTRQSLINLTNVLAEAGLTLQDVVKTTVLLADIADFSRVNAVYAEMFGENKPARSCFQVAALPAGGLVEIECIACKG